ncbi:hypothetical protein C8Q70DRAFT_886601, partial [Cubamyces menziesii]
EIPHRTSLTQQVLLQYWKEYQLMTAELRAAPGRVSFTVDLWEDQERLSFMGVTAHHCEE